MNRFPHRKRGRLFIVSGPSGVGKDTVLGVFHQHISGIHQAVTVSTRTMRPGESQGNPYRFVTLSEFNRIAEQNAFLEYALVNGNYYGTPRQFVEEQRDQGHDVLLKIDVQGGLTVRSRAEDAILIFLAPPSLEELERRLRVRDTETEDQITRRLLDARSEMEQVEKYDYVVINYEVEEAADHLRAIIIAERCRLHPTVHRHA
ncbi:MAG: guanylate kinase [Capsulimonadales bacterium]|nr:guanylate kinase [Capsulimonadales bacterium]